MQGPQTLRVQVPNNHVLTQNLYYNYYYPKPKYLIIGYLDPLGKELPGSSADEESASHYMSHTADAQSRRLGKKPSYNKCTIQLDGLMLKWRG